jgi:N-acetylmuramic acid 6-phosphate etherase
MYSKAHKEAENFLNNETQFHLGMLPTEQSNPKTRGLDQIFAASYSKGVKTLLSVDEDVYSMAKKVLAGNEFEKMVTSGLKAVSEGKKIVFSGCGATGRLSILLESMWRCFFRDLRKKYPDIYNKTKDIENAVFSIMTGGDYALIRAVEFFEDYQEFGRQQARELNITSGDMLVAITEGGETSSVLGTLAEAADRGAEVFLLFNNPASVLCEYIERSRKAIQDPRVTVLDLFCGPMAIVGSTRMQATTSEQLVAGAALEIILGRYFSKLLITDELIALNIRDINYAEAFKSVLDELISGGNTDILGDYIKLEESIYRANGLITYFGNGLLLDIFTDTAERTPTFMLPPFKKFDDTVSPPSWAFVKNPLLSTDDTWENLFGRPPRCLEWDRTLYRKLGAADNIVSNPPLLDTSQIVKFRIGNEEDASRLSRTPNIAVSVLGRSEVVGPDHKEYYAAFTRTTTKFQRRSSLIIGNSEQKAEYQIACSPLSSVLNLMEHLAVKLVLNTVSTGTMVAMGRVSGNWMNWFDVTNKKLIDRGIRLIAESCDLNYRDACYALHETLEELKTVNSSNTERISPVQYTIRKVNSAGKNVK